MSDKEFLLCTAKQRVAEWLTSFTKSHGDWPYQDEDRAAVVDLPHSLHQPLYIYGTKTTCEFDRPILRIGRSEF